MENSLRLLPAFSLHEITNAEEKPLLNSSNHTPLEKSVEVLVVYGGFSKQDISNLALWLSFSKTRSLFVVESDAGRLKALMNHLSNESNILSQITLCLEKYLDDNTLAQLGWEVALKPFEILSFNEENEKDFLLFKSKVMSCFFHHHWDCFRCERFSCEKIYQYSSKYEEFICSNFFKGA